MSVRQTRFGSPAPLPSGSAHSEVAYELGGMDRSQPVTDLPVGRAYVTQNVMGIDGGLVCRPSVWAYPFSASTATLSAPMATQILGGAEIVSVTGVPSHIVSGTTNWAWYSNGSWSRLSYVTAGGISDPPSLSTVSFWDIIQTYDPVSDEMLAVGAGSYQSLYCWKSGSTLFSTLTSAPRAKYVASYDNYLVALNIRDPSSSASLYVQRVQWSDRGNPSNWTSGLAGSEDLLDMKGTGTRIIADGRRLIVFSDLEIWQGVTANAPFQFLFSAIDRSVGCPYPWSVCQSPAGVFFLGNGFRPYLLPADGGTAQPIGDRIKSYLASFLNSNPAVERIWSVYEPYNDSWRLFFPASSDYPGYAMSYHLPTGEWFFHNYTNWLDATGTMSNGKTMYFPRGWIGRSDTVSTGTAWNASGFSGTYTWNDVPGSWSQMAPNTTYGPRLMFMGTSTGTIVRERADIGMYPFDKVDNSNNTIHAYWLGRATAGELPEGGKTITEVAVLADAGSATSFAIRALAGGVSVSQQTIGIPNATYPTQRSAHLYATGRTMMIRLLANPWRVAVRRLLVKYRTGEGYSGADF